MTYALPLGPIPHGSRRNSSQETAMIHEFDGTSFVPTGRKIAVSNPWFIRVAPGRLVAVDEMAGRWHVVSADIGPGCSYWSRPPITPG